MPNRRFIKEINLHKNEEFNEQNNRWDSYIDNCLYMDNNDNEIKFLIILSDNYYTQINIQIDNCYPFRPPIVSNISKSQKIIFKCHNIQDNKSYFNIYYKKIRPTNKCLHCDSILCKNNWSPAFGLSHVLKEFKLNFQNNLRIVELMHCQKIMNRHCGYEIPVLYEFI